jgi:hypothetical protein
MAHATTFTSRKMVRNSRHSTHVRTRGRASEFADYSTRLKPTCGAFSLESNGASPQGWRWRADAQISSLPHISTSQAVTFLMVEEHLRHLLPPSLLDELRPWFDMAQRAVNHSR